MNGEIRAVSVIIPNWNGLKFLATCLDSLRRQSTRDFQTVLVDNGSTDGSVEFIRERYPEVRLLALDRNHGFSEAINAGIRQSSSPYVALLNNDTEADPNWLENCLQTLEHRLDIGYVACQMLDFYCRGRLDSAGDTMTRTGLPLKRGMDQPARGEFLVSREVMGASAGAAFFRREVLDRIGLLDPGYFMYLEDVDWCLRAALQGIRCLYVPEAKVYHVEGGSDPDRNAFLQRGDTQRRLFHSRDRTYWITRNRVRLLAKNYPAVLLVKLSPWIFYGFLRSALFHLLKSGMFMSYASGLWQGLMGVRECLPLRRQIQSQRQVSTRQFEKILFG